MRSFIGEDGKEYVELTKEEKEKCFALIKGEAAPSDFGWDFTEAALFIAWFMHIFEKAMPEDKVPPKFREQHARFKKDASELSRTLSEVGKLIGEQDDPPTAGRFARDGLN